MKSPELRQHPYQGFWVLYAPQRLVRPQISVTWHTQSTQECPFCPGQEGKTPPEFLAYPSREPPNSTGWQVRVVPNLYPATPQTPKGGMHFVIVESPRHQVQYSQLSDREIEVLWSALREVYRKCEAEMPHLFWQYFKNSAPLAGASQTHPHSQLIGLPTVGIPLRYEIAFLNRHIQFWRNLHLFGVSLWQGEHFFAFLPLASRQPYEVALYPYRGVASPSQLNSEEISELRVFWQWFWPKLEHLLGPNFAFHTLVYSLPPAQAPKHFRWHLEILPRVGTIGGFELASSFFINPIFPEEAQVHLQSLTE